MDKTDFSLCLVGAGNMGGAMLAGWIDSGIAAERLTIIDPKPGPKIAETLNKHGIRSVGAPPEHYQPDILVIAVKPQIMADLLPSLAPLAGSDTVSVSVAAGSPISLIERHLGNGSVVRVMPNTPALLRRGISVACPNQAVTAGQKRQVTELLKAIGKVEWIEDEKQLDAVTAVSGSGPAYVFHLAECMTKAGEAEGLPHDLAEVLARETIAGAGEMLSQLDEDAAQLRKNVTSPNGTTAAALSVLMGEDALEDLVKRAIAKARRRSEELSG